MTPRERFNERLLCEMDEVDSGERLRLDRFLGQRIGKLSRAEVQALLATEFGHLEESDHLVISWAYFGEPYSLKLYAEAVDREIAAERAELLAGIFRRALRHFGAQPSQPAALGDTTK